MLSGMNFNFGLGVLLLTLFSQVLSNPVDVEATKKPFTIEESALRGLDIESFSGKWVSDTELEYLDKTTKDVKVVDVTKNKTEVVLKGSILEKYKTVKYTFSADRKFVLICYDEKAIFRFSRTAKYVVYSVKDGKFYDLANKEPIQIAEWGPKNNVLVFIKDNNIYVVLSITDKMTATQITNNGKAGVVSNGLGDWVYEEEILSSGKAFWFSPDGEQLAFATFYDANVKKVLVPDYNEPGDLKHQYVEFVEVPYPKAGSTNPTYQLLHVNFKNPKKIIEISKTKPGREILHNLMWPNDQVVVYSQTNRVQNESKVTACEVKENGKCQTIFEHNNTKGWANVNLPFVSSTGAGGVRIEGVPVGKLGNFKHLVYYNLTTGKSYALTGGAYEVIKIIKWDEARKKIYYEATEENNSTTTQIYSVEVNGKTKPFCITCRIKSPEGRGCKYASAKFSPKASYIIISCSGPDPQVDYLFKYGLPLEAPLAVLTSNSKLRKTLETKLMPEIMNLTIQVPGPFDADVRLFLPPNLDKSGKTKYPMIIYVYGGPASKNIYDNFKIDWGHYLSTNLSIIYGMIDGRNTLRKGENMLFAGYKALGTFEMEDQINVTRALQKRFPFIDSARTGIWGWSYGGYATTKILELDTQNIFKCGIAVAPVADWIYYDSMYTERYLSTPQDNPKGYERSSVLKNVSNLRNKQYFLIHGNADDNVHYQNAMMIAKLLERQNIPFELMSYPDEDHSLKDVRKHLYYSMDRFWKKCFKICC